MYACPEQTIHWIGQAGDEGMDADGRTAGSDGGGGPESSDPRLRRAGWAWVVLDHLGKVIGGARGTLDATTQTVYCAELYGALHCILHTRGTLSSTSITKRLGTASNAYGKDGN